MNNCVLPPPKSNAHEIFDAKSKVYDHIFIGGGIASLAPALILLREAAKSKKSVNIAVLSKELNAPCLAGSHFVLECEGQFQSNDKSTMALTPILKSGLAEMVSILEQEQIECRAHTGYEIKAKTEEELNNIIQEMTEKNIYAKNDFKINSTSQTFKLTSYNHSATIAHIGQLNTPEYIFSLPEKISQKGGTCLTGIEYKNHAKTPQGLYEINTNHGIFKTRNPPYMATGANHIKKLLGNRFNTKIIYTLGAVLGPLSNEDASKISNGPMAFCDTNLHGDVIWGGIDSKNILTVGFGDMEDPAERSAKEKTIIEKIESLYPNLTKKYPPEFSFGPMLVAENKMPIVGSMKDFDVASGWAGMGIVPSHSAGLAYAQKHIHGYDKNWKFFQSLQPNRF